MSISSKEQSMQQDDGLVNEALNRLLVEDNEAPNNKVITSRFGDLEVNTDRAICFEHGILGAPGKIRFALADIPNHDDNGFKLLQCIENDGLCFMVVPSLANNNIIQSKDLEDACNVLNIEQKSLLILFIARMWAEGGSTKVSINAKAPLLIDIDSKTGTQYVLQNPTYEVRHVIV